MKEVEIRPYAGKHIEASLMNSRLVLRGMLSDVDDGNARFASIDELFALVHGKRLSLKLMLSGSFADLEALLRNLYFPCNLFDKIRTLGVVD